MFFCCFTHWRKSAEIRLDPQEQDPGGEQVRKLQGQPLGEHSGLSHQARCGLALRQVEHDDGIRRQFRMSLLQERQRFVMVACLAQNAAEPCQMPGGLGRVGNSLLGQFQSCGAVFHLGVKTRERGKKDGVIRSCLDSGSQELFRLFEVA